MKRNNLSQALLICLFISLLFTTCKKTESKLDSFPSFGKVYPISGNQNLLGAIKTPDNGYLLWGYTNGVFISGRDAFAMRLDENCKQLWYKTYGGQGDDAFSSVAFDNDGNIILAGSTTSYGRNGINEPIGSGFVVSITRWGDKLWQKIYEGGYTNWPHPPNASYPKTTNYGNVINKIMALPSGKIAMIGYTQNFPQSINGTAKTTPRGYIWMINDSGRVTAESFYDLTSLTPGKEYIAYSVVSGSPGKDGSIYFVLAEYGQKYNPYTFIELKDTFTYGFLKNISARFLSAKNKPFAFNKIKDFDLNMVSADTTNDTYFLGLQDEIVLITKTGYEIKSLKLTNPVSDIAVSNGFAWLLSENGITKTSLNLDLLWQSDFDIKLKLQNAYGLFPQADNSLIVFCSFLNAVNEMEIAMLCLDPKGKLIFK